MGCNLDVKPLSVKVKDFSIVEHYKQKYGVAKRL